MIRFRRLLPPCAALLLASTAAAQTRQNPLLAKSTLPFQAPPFDKIHDADYEPSYFLHIWANGYAAGYYAYLWTEMLADDAAAWFDAHGGLTRANGDRFRDMVLSRGNTEDLAKMFRDFTGHDPEIGPMLVNRGLSGY